MSGFEAVNNHSKQNTGYRSLLIISRYPTIFIPVAFISMAVFHFPLWLNRRVLFYKLMGCGKNGTFDIRPDFNQWAIMVFYKPGETKVKSGEQLVRELCGRFVSGWWKIFSVKNKLIHLEPVAGHGTWDGKSFISPENNTEGTQGQIGVLTRATIRLSRLAAFWKAVPSTADKLESNPGFIYSVGIGEIPFIKQATFSIWESEDQMKAFAYRKSAHREVIKKTREEGWYSEEMFLRFRVLEQSG